MRFHEDEVTSCRMMLHEITWGQMRSAKMGGRGHIRLACRVSEPACFGAAPARDFFSPPAPEDIAFWQIFWNV